MRTALPLSGRGPAEACAETSLAAWTVTYHVTRREPRKRRGSSSWMPATAAIDNETLDHLLSMSALSVQLEKWPVFSGLLKLRRAAAASCFPPGAHRGHKCPRARPAMVIHHRQGFPPVCRKAVHRDYHHPDECFLPIYRKTFRSTASTAKTGPTISPLATGAMLRGQGSRGRRRRSCRSGWRCGGGAKAVADRFVMGDRSSFSSVGPDRKARPLETIPTD